jgi:carbohydrate-selective porin OprB
MRNWCARPFRLGRGGSLLLLSAWLGYPAAADDSPTLTGDWGGVRTQVLDPGINLTTIYTSELANNPRGGDEERTGYADEFAIGAHSIFKDCWAGTGDIFRSRLPIATAMISTKPLLCIR